MMTDRRLALCGFAIGVVGYCIAGFASGHHTEFVRSVIAIAFGATVARVIAGIAGHARAARRLRAQSRPTEVAGVPARVGTLGPGAFVAGILRPEIYIDERLVEQLPPRQLRAVMLHELAHKQARDPLRLALLDVVAPLMRPFRTGRAWLVWAAAQPEIRADEQARSRGASRSSLASALLTLEATRSPGLAAFTSAIDLRLQALLDEPTGPGVDGRIVGLAVVLVSAGAGMSTCAWLLHGVIMASAGTIL